MKGNWGGILVLLLYNVLSWAILSLDHMGRVKKPTIGSAQIVRP
jgi:hypothetical protein